VSFGVVLPTNAATYYNKSQDKKLLLYVENTENTVVKTLVNGTVVKASSNNVVIRSLQNKLVSYQLVNNPIVAVGETVEKGQTIASATQGYLVSTRQVGLKHGQAVKRLRLLQAVLQSQTTGNSVSEMLQTISNLSYSL
jgi:hypothetical protein